MIAVVNVHQCFPFGLAAQQTGCMDVAQAASNIFRPNQCWSSTNWKVSIDPYRAIRIAVLDVHVTNGVDKRDSSQIPRSYICSTYNKLPILIHSTKITSYTAWDADCCSLPRIQNLMFKVST